VTRAPHFRDRAEAGRRLASVVATLRLDDAVVLGLPRGGVPVAAEVAVAIGGPLDVLVARKLGAPRQPELGIGAIAEGGGRVLDERSLALLRVTDEQLADVVTREEHELARRIARYRGDRPLRSLHDRTIVLVDDGLATGVTATAAVRSVLLLGAARVIVAVPVAAPDAVERLDAEGSEVVVVGAPASFGAVGQFYDRFAPTTDEEVERLLARATG